MTTVGTLPLPLPAIIQGGMGIGVSNWLLARAVALGGQLGVVSGTCIDTLFVRRLQDGDVGGDLRRAIADYPMPDVGSSVLRKHAGVFPYYCTNFCSALHQEMQGYLEVVPKGQRLAMYVNDTGEMQFERRTPALAAHGSH